MAKTVRIVDGQPEAYSFEQLRADNPNTSFPSEMPPERLKEWGLHTVLETETKPDVAPNEKAVVSYEQDGPNWKEQWTAIKLTGEELVVRNEEVRHRAASLMRETDHCELPSIAARIANGEEMALYRAALLDIFVEAPADVKWPVRPETVWK